MHPNGLRQHRPKTPRPGLSGASHLGVWSAKTGYSWCVCDLFICERMERRCRACGLALGDCSDAKPPRVGAGGIGSLGQCAGSAHLPRALGCPQRCVVAVPRARGTAGDITVPGVGSIPVHTALRPAAVTQRRGFCSGLNAPSTTCEALPPAWQGKGSWHWHGGMVGTCPQLGGMARGGEGTAGGSAVSSGMLGRGPGESHLAAKLWGRKWSGGILVSPAASCQLARCTWVASWRGFVSGVGIVHAPRPQALLLAIGNCWRGSSARAAGERGQPVGSQHAGVALPRSSSSSLSSPGSFSGSKQEQTGDASPRRAPRAGECWRAGAVGEAVLPGARQFLSPCPLPLKQIAEGSAKEDCWLLTPLLFA